MKRILLFCIATLMLTSCKFSGHHSGALSKGDTIISYSKDSNWQYSEVYDTLTHGPIYFAKTMGRNLFHFRSSDIFAKVTMVIRYYKNKNVIYFALNKGECAPLGKNFVPISLTLDDIAIKCDGGGCPADSKQFIFAHIADVDNLLEGIKYGNMLTLNAILGKEDMGEVYFKVSGLTWDHKGVVDTTAPTPVKDTNRK